MYVERAIVTDVVRKKEKRDCCRKEMGREIWGLRQKKREVGTDVETEKDGDYGRKEREMGTEVKRVMTSVDYNFYGNQPDLIAWTRGSSPPWVLISLRSLLFISRILTVEDENEMSSLLTSFLVLYTSKPSFCPSRCARDVAWTSPGSRSLQMTCKQLFLLLSFCNLYPHTLRCALVLSLISSSQTGRTKEQ